MLSAALVLVGTLLLAAPLDFEPLNSRTARKCMNSVEEFVGDYNSEEYYHNYYRIHIEMISGVYVYDTNQISTGVYDDRVVISVSFNNIIWFNIVIEKSSAKEYHSSERGFFNFSFNQKLGYRTSYRKSFDKGGNGPDEILFIMRGIFSSFDL